MHIVYRQSRQIFLGKNIAGEMQTRKKDQSGRFFLYILLTMDEKSQIIYMQTRLTRLAAEQWKMSLLQVASLFEEKGVYHYIAKMWDLFHVEGDLAVLDDIKQYLDAKEVACG